MDGLLILVVIILALAAVAALGWVFYRRRRTEHLRQKFGPEYDRAVDDVGHQARAEAELAEREKRAQSLHTRPLNREESARFSRAWQGVQARFVDEPMEAISDAEILTRDVMEAMGYPAGDFEQRMAFLSVDYPRAAQSYRATRGVTRNVRYEDVTTEDLRHAMIKYRELLDELLEAGETSVMEPGRSRN